MSMECRGVAPATQPVAVKFRSPLRTLLLAGTAMAGGLLATMPPALAACVIGAAPNVVNCNANTPTTDTTNTDAGSTSSTDRHQTFSAGGAIAATIQAGVTVSGAGLAIQTTEPGAAIDFTHDGIVNQTVAGAQGGVGALHITAAGYGGSITYAGNGSVTTNQASDDAIFVITTVGGTVTFGTSGAPIIPTISSAGGGIRTSTALGDNNVFLNGGTITVAGTGVTASAGSGNVGITLTGSTTINGGNLGGVTGLATSGNVTVESDANIGSAGTRVSTGIGAGVSSLAGAASVTQTGGTIFANAFGMNATAAGTGSVTLVQNAGTIDAAGGIGMRGLTTGAAGDVTVTVAGGGVVASVTGVQGLITNAASTGNVTVTTNASIVGSATGISTEHGGTGTITVNGTGDVHGGVTTGIRAFHNGSGPGAGNAILVTGSGNTSATAGTGIDARIQAASNGADILVNRTGTVTVAANGGDGIFTFTPGSGTITITGVGNVTGGTGANDYGIRALAAGGNVNITANGTISGANGVRASTSGTGTVLVGTGGQVTALAGHGITTTSTGGSTTINVLHAVVATGGNGVEATADTGNTAVQVQDHVVATGVGINLSGGTANAVVNDTGTFITAATGIQAAALAGGSTIISNSGVITGTGGTAVRFTGGTGNRLSLVGAGAALNGNAIGNGNDIFRLTGTGPNTFNISQVVSGFTSFQKQGTSTWTLTGSGTAAQNWQIADGTLRGDSTSIQGAAIINIAELVFDQNFAGAYAGAIGGTGTFTKAGSGALTLTGTSTYNGDTTVNGGSLLVNGSIASSATTVNAGATLGGTGTVGSTTINGGTLAPGNSIGTLTIQGNLVLTAAATYLAEVSVSTADRTNITGTATLGGTLNAQFAPGAYLTRSYTLMSAGTRAGTFNTFTTTDLPSGFAAELAYVGNDVVLNLTALLGALGTGGLNQNQLAVANSLNTFFNNGGTLPPSFVAVFGLTGTNLAGMLSQLSGEVRAAGPQAAFQSTHQFLNLMLDPFTAGRTGGMGAAPIAFAAQMPEEIVLAYAKAGMPVKAASLAYEPRWSVWGGAYGGTAKTHGDAAVGSNTTDSRTGGFAAGADYRLWPDTVVGFALAGGGTSWSLANGLGSGRSDTFQAGLYGSQRFGAAYLSAALAYAWHDATTSRSVSIGPEMLEGRFRPHVLSGRAEAGHRFGWASWGVTPYLAAQVQSFRAPSYTEAATVGAGTFALSFASQTETATRTEVGLWADHRARVTADTDLVLRGRAAWAHDYDTSRRVNPTFLALPGASFTIDGAAPSPDLALLSAVAELRMQNGLSLSAKFDGEFGARSGSYAATGTLRYAW